MSGQGFLRKFIQFASACVALDLEIPGVRIVPAEPVPKCFEAGPIQFLDFAFQQLNFCHLMSLP